MQMWALLVCVTIQWLDKCAFLERGRKSKQLPQQLCQSFIHLEMNARCSLLFCHNLIYVKQSSVKRQ